MNEKSIKNNINKVETQVKKSLTDLIKKNSHLTENMVCLIFIMGVELSKIAPVILNNYAHLMEPHLIKTLQKIASINEDL